MKIIKLHTLFIAVICLIVNNNSFGQDPTTSGLNFNPNPITSVKGNIVYFTFLNNSDTTAEKSTDDVALEITFTNLQPDVTFDSSKDITGQGAGLFDWSYNRVAHSVEGTLKANIPAGTSYVIYISNIIVTNTSSSKSPSNGFDVRVNADTHSDLVQGNDNSTAVTYTNFSTLPVTLIGFTGNENLCKANLKWATEAEMNFNHFDVQQSLDGVNFTTIGSVNSNHKANGSNYQISYIMPGGIVFYRLKIVDNNGSFNYSEIIHFKSSCPNTSLIKVYPNPAVNNVTVTGLSLNAQVNILSINGQLLSKAIATNTSLIMDVSRYAKGSYLLEVIDNGKSVNKTTIIK